MASIFRLMLQRSVAYSGRVGNRHFGRSTNALCAQGEQGMGRIGNFHHPSNFDKKVLVWTKFYPSVDKVPETVSYTQLTKAKDLFRIRVNIGMALATALAAVGIIISGRRARDRGDSVQRRGIARQKQLQEQGRQEREQAQRLKDMKEDK